MLLFELSEKYGFEYVYTRRLCQNHFENTFSRIRGLGGYDDNNTTCRLFEAAFLKVASINLHTLTKFGNSEGDIFRYQSFRF